MRKRIACLLLIILICIGGCSPSSAKNSSFSILFIDVGQGDAALIECDGHYMLIDGGDTTAGDKVYSVLEQKGIQKLDILAISHLHRDHFGGLTKALTYASSIGITISNSSDGKTEAFRAFERQLSINGSQISVPRKGEKYRLESAEIEVLDTSSSDDNDSLVLLITYQNTRFLFTGDIEEDAQRRILQQYQNENDDPFKINVIKMPHHGADVLVAFVRTFMPDYAIISVGRGNIYGHPYNNTLVMLDQADTKVYRTDLNGDILVLSDGKKVSVQPQK